MNKKLPWFLFLIFLLTFAGIIRSEIIPDSTFLPRLISLNILLFVTVFIRFISGRKKHFSIYDIIFFLFFLWNFAGILWSIVPSETIAGSMVLFGAFSLFIIIRNLFIYEEFRIFFIKILILILIFSFFTGFKTIFSLKYFDPYRISSICGNNNLYSGFLLISLPFLIYGYIILKGLWKFISVITGVSAAFFIIIVQSRAGYLGLLISFLLIFLFLIIKFRNLISFKNIRNGLTAAILLILMVSVFYISLDDVRRNYFRNKIPVWNYFGSYESIEKEKAERKLKKVSDYQHMAQFDFAEDYYENTSLRLIFWGKSLKLIKDHPFTGVGAGNWRIVVPSSPDPPNPGHTFKNYTYSQPHNEWIAFISELGIPGFLIALFLFLAPVIIVFFRKIRKKNISFEKIIFASFITGFYLFASFDFPFHRIEHLVIFIPALAFITINTGGEIFEKPVFTAGRPVYLFFILILGFSLVVDFYRFRGEYYTMKMFREERKNDVAVITYADKAENIFYRITPNGLPVVWFRGVAEYRLGLKQQALSSFEKASEITPYEVRILNDYGITLFDLGKKDSAISVLRYTYLTDKDFDDAKLNLAAIYLISGRPDSARFFLSTCRESERKKTYSSVISEK